MEAVRCKDGIPLQPEVVQWMRNTCEKLSVRCLFWGLALRLEEPELVQWD